MVSMEKYERGLYLNSIKTCKNKLDNFFII